MKIIKPSYEFITPINREVILKRIEETGRVCYKSEHLITEGSASKFVSMLIKRGHEAMIEHCSFSVKFIVDRGVSHEIVRHRVASYAQESTRYCNYSKDKFNNNITYIDLADVMLSETKDAQEKAWEWIQICTDTFEYLEQMYLKLINLGCTPQLARAILPNALKTELVVTMNLREWRHFFKLRCDKTAHPQMREVTIPLLNELKELLPEIFSDIEVQDV